MPSAVAFAPSPAQHALQAAQFSDLHLPALQGAADIAKVEQAAPNANAMEDSLARVFYAPESEQAVNEQIKQVPTYS